MTLFRRWGRRRDPFVTHPERPLWSELKPGRALVFWTWYCVAFLIWNLVYTGLSVATQQWGWAGFYLVVSGFWAVMLQRNRKAWAELKQRYASTNEELRILKAEMLASGADPDWVNSLTYGHVARNERPPEVS